MQLRFDLLLGALNIGWFKAAANESDVAEMTRDNVLLANELMTYYNCSPDGQWGHPWTSETFLWWQTGIAWAAIFDSARLTHNTTYLQPALHSMRWNEGDRHVYEPWWGGIENGESNDDQMWFFYGAVAGWQVAPGATDWLDNLRRGLWLVSRYWADVREDCDRCKGGIRWQKDPAHIGYFYLNTVSTGQYMFVSAFMYAQTGNATYQGAVEDSWRWLVRMKLISKDVHVWDGVWEMDCLVTPENKMELTYNHGILIAATAMMYKATGANLWKQRTELLVNATQRYLTLDNVIYEPTCEGKASERTCDGLNDLAFKAVLARGLALAWEYTRNPLAKRIVQESYISMLNYGCDRARRHCGYSWKAPGLHGNDANLLTQMCALALSNAALQVLDDS